MLYLSEEKVLHQTSSLVDSNEGIGVVRLYLSNFRNYQNLTLNTDTRHVVLTGANGAGKTNLLEALSLLTPGRGMRRAKLSEMTFATNSLNSPSPIKWAVAAKIVKSGEEIEVGTGLETNPETGSEKRVIKIDGKLARNQSALGEVTSTLWLTPSMDRLFKGAPSHRRRFLDRLVYSFDPEHARRTAAYEHALKEWSLLLKQNRGDNKWLSALEETLASEGVAVAVARKQAVARLNAVMLDGCGEFPVARLSLEGEIESWLEAMPALAVEEKFKETLMQTRKKTAQNGESPLGPHRSDLLAEHLGKGIMADRCSTGEQKAILIAVTLAEARAKKRDTGIPPIMLLDEIAAHLDEKRRVGLFDEITALGAQSWLTGTDATVFAHLKNRAQFFNVDNAELLAA